MGQESSAVLIRGRTKVAGKAHLEGDHLLFRGEEVREKQLLSAVTAATIDGARLVLEHADGVMRLELPAGVAEGWAARIRNPKSRIDKLGVKPGMQVAILDVDDPTLRDELLAKGATIPKKIPDGVDVIFLGAESPTALGQLARLRERLTPTGAIWVVHRKGKGATLKDVEVFAAAKRAGLVDNKVASFSATHTAERLVIPLAARPRG